MARAKELHKIRPGQQIGPADSGCAPVTSAPAPSTVTSDLAYKLAQFPTELLQRVCYLALEDADAVAAYLTHLTGTLGQELTELLLTREVLLGMGVVLRFARWEAVGLNPHRSVNLPSSQELFSRIIHSLRVDQGGTMNWLREICSQALEISINQFAWAAPTQLGAEVSIYKLVDTDEDKAVDAIAEFLWNNRNHKRDIKGKED